jgi:hypothetical protein
MMVERFVRSWIRGTRRWEEHHRDLMIPGFEGEWNIGATAVGCMYPTSREVTIWYLAVLVCLGGLYPRHRPVASKPKRERAVRI